MSHNNDTKYKTRNGKMATVYGVVRNTVLDAKDIIRDVNENPFPFESGQRYKGEWVDNKKQGFGVEIKKDGTKYEGEWIEGRYHGKGTLWVNSKQQNSKQQIKEYEGEWCKGKMEGVGIYYYSNGEIYHGQFFKGQRSGNGKLKYSNGDYYIGEWDQDKQNGNGSLYMINGNVYDGRWLHGMKEGPGRFFYAATRKVYEGEWVDNTPVCGQYREPTSSEIVSFKISNVRINEFILPEIGLSNPRGVIDLATTETRLQRSNTRGMNNNNNNNNNNSTTQNPENIMSAAQSVFETLDLNSKGTIPFNNVYQVLEKLGLQLSFEELDSIRQELDIKETQQFSLPEIIDIASFLGNPLDS